MGIPLDCATVSRFANSTDEIRTLNSFVVRAATDVNKTAILRPRKTLPWAALQKRYV